MSNFRAKNKLCTLSGAVPFNRDDSVPWRMVIYVWRHFWLAGMASVVGRGQLF